MTAPPVDSAPDGIMIEAVVSAAGCAVTVRGDVDAVTARRLRECLLQALGRPGVTAVDLALSGVTFLDSAGLTTLVVAHRAAEDAGRALRLRCGTDRAVRRPLEITGLLTVLTVVDG